MLIWEGHLFSVEERKAAGPMVMINVMKTKDKEAAKRLLSSFSSSSSSAASFSSCIIILAILLIIFIILIIITVLLPSKVWRRLFLILPNNRHKTLFCRQCKVGFYSHPCYQLLDLNLIKCIYAHIYRLGWLLLGQNDKKEDLYQTTIVGSWSNAKRSDYWDTVALIEYESIDSFCTMVSASTFDDKGTVSKNLSCTITNTFL